MHEYIEVCEQAARAGGKTLLEWQDRIRVREKGPRDLVTEADVASQEAIQEVIRRAFPDHAFLGEETWPMQPADGGGSSGGYRWIADPLDGTTNYVHGMPFFSVSVALEHEGELLAGVVYNPVSDECFWAQLGGGAWLDGQRLETSGVRRMNEAMLAASFPARVLPDSPEMRRFAEVLVQCQSLRRLGSAALNLSYVAAGRLDGYFATSLKIWDAAAGALLVREAGGCLVAADGSAFELNRPKLVAAATPELCEALVAALGRVRTD
jgi:myo-inositol-1(or 4)-monophosphatase